MSYTERNRRIETVTTRREQFFADGQLAYDGPVSARTETVAERVCDCGHISEVRGVMGPIRWMAEGCPACGVE